MAAEYTKPLPNVQRERSKPFWDATKRRELVLQKCPGCGYVRHPAASLCPECLAENNEWAPMSGRGEVWSFGIYHQVYNPAFRDDVPYNVALVRLDEGPILISNIVNTPKEDIHIGMKVKVAFDEVTDEATLPKFEPA
jgi:uncharacterized OB-fold protein